jgi:hypothetical protein
LARKGKADFASMIYIFTLSSAREWKKKRALLWNWPTLNYYFVRSIPVFFFFEDDVQQLLRIAGIRYINDTTV